MEVLTGHPDHWTAEQQALHTSRVKTFMDALRGVPGNVIVMELRDIIRGVDFAGMPKRDIADSYARMEHEGWREMDLAEFADQCRRELAQRQADKQAEQEERERESQQDAAWSSRAQGIIRGLAGYGIDVRPAFGWGLRLKRGKLELGADSADKLLAILRDRVIPSGDFESLLEECVDCGEMVAPYEFGERVGDNIVCQECVSEREKNMRKGG